MFKSLLDNYEKRPMTQEMTSLSVKLLKDLNFNVLIEMENLKINRQFLKIPKETKSIRQLHENILRQPLNFAPTEFEEFYQYYKKTIVKNIQKLENKKKELTLCNAVGHGPLYFLVVLDGSNKLLQKFIKSFRLFYYKLTSIPFSINYDSPRFFFFTQQRRFYPFFTPSSLALDQKQLVLFQSQKQFLKKIHMERKIDKYDYTGSYGVYFQLVYKPLSWFGEYNRSYMSNMSMYIFDAQVLLSKIVSEMKEVKRKNEFIYFNPGWFFGRKDSNTIEYTKDFLQECRPHLESRNETIFRWIIPVNLEYGLVWISQPVQYGTTYY